MADPLEPGLLLAPRLALGLGLGLALGWLVPALVPGSALELLGLGKRAGPLGWWLATP